MIQLCVHTIYTNNVSSKTVLLSIESFITLYNHRKCRFPHFSLHLQYSRRSLRPSHSDWRQALEWSSYSDWAMLPHIFYFEGVPELFLKLMDMEVGMWQDAANDGLTECLSWSLLSILYPFLNLWERCTEQRDPCIQKGKRYSQVVKITIDVLWCYRPSCQHQHPWSSSMMKNLFWQWTIGGMLHTGSSGGKCFFRHSEIVSGKLQDSRVFVRIYMPCFSNWRMCFDVLLGSTPHPVEVPNEGSDSLQKL